MPETFTKHAAVWKPLALIVVAVILVTQSVMLWLSATDDKSRNLMMIEKSPYRIIMRWDTADNEDNPKIEALLIQERQNIMDIISSSEFKDYKFNDTLNVNIRTETIKADSSNVDIKELESITDNSKDIK